MATAAATTIGFVGLGHMGGNMAARLLAAGYSVYGEERHRGHADELVHDGLHWRDTPREVAEAANIVFTSVPDDGVLEQVASGQDGILAGLTADKLWVDMSTVSPNASRELAERVHVLGAAMLDAPVSGSVPQVQAGTLTIMVGGDKQAYARVEPILRELGTPTHIGENGQGLVLKLAINISLAVQMLAFAEGLLLAERAGVDRKLAVDVMTQSPIGSPMLKARAALFFDLPEEAWFDVRLMQKDIVLALDAARELHVPLPSAAAADELLTVARALGYERRDLAALFPVLAQLAGDDSRHELEDRVHPSTEGDLSGSIDGPTIEVDRDGTITAVNAAAAEITGFGPDELLGQHFHILVPSDQAAVAASNFERKLADPTLVTRYQIDIERKDGLRRAIEVTSRRVEEPGSPTRVRGVWKTALAP